MVNTKLNILISAFIFLLSLATGRAQTKEPTETITRPQGVQLSLGSIEGHDVVKDTLPTESRQRLNTLLAIKTNVLFDLLATPNIEIEVPFGKQSRWSMMAEFWTPWYKWHNNTRAYQLQVFGLEMRYWTTSRAKMKRSTLCGTFFGVYYANGRYDLEWNAKGNQGEFNSIGATYGYSWRLSRYFNVEASATLGYLWGPRRHYQVQYGDHLIWKYTGSVNYFGPTKLKVSLVWLLGKRGSDHQTKGGAQ